MSFFIESVDLNDVRDSAATGLVDGVTMNPSLLAKTGGDLSDVLEEIGDIPPAIRRQFFIRGLIDKGLAAFLADWQKTGRSMLSDEAEVSTVA